MSDRRRRRRNKRYRKYLNCETGRYVVCSMTCTQQQ